MSDKAIIFDHNTATITSTGDSAVNIGGKIYTHCNDCNRTIEGQYKQCPYCKYKPAYVPNLTYKEEGALLIGDGENIDLDAETEKEGILCVSKDPQKGYQLKASNKNGSWDVLGEPYDDSMDMIYVIIMSH